MARSVAAGAHPTLLARLSPRLIWHPEKFHLNEGLFAKELELHTSPSTSNTFGPSAIQISTVE